MPFLMPTTNFGILDSRHSSTLWTPAAYGASSNIYSWYDFSDAANYTLYSSNAYQTVNNKKGAGAPLYNNSSTNSGTVTKINNLNAIAFNANANTYVYANGTYSITGTNMTVVGVAVVNTGQAYGNARWMHFNGNSGNDYGNATQFSIQTVGNAYSNANTWSINSLGYPASEIITLGTPFVYSVSFDGTNAYTWSNGGTLQQAAAAQNFAITGLRIGYSQSVNTFFNGTVGEFITSSKIMNTNDRQLAEGYLAHKYNIPLVSGHPYITNAPTQ